MGNRQYQAGLIFFPKGSILTGKKHPQIKPSALTKRMTPDI